MQCVACGAMLSEVFVWTWWSSPSLGAWPPLWCAEQSSRNACCSATIVSSAQY